MLTPSQARSASIPLALFAGRVAVEVRGLASFRGSAAMLRGRGGITRDPRRAAEGDEFCFKANRQVQR